MKPALVGHARLQIDRVTGATMVLFPEGALELSESAAAVVRLCDGARSVDQVVAGLAEEFEGVREEDVRAVIEGLAARGLMTQ